MASNITVQTASVNIDRDESESARSDSSQVSFVDDYENLPAGGPVSHAHIIDLKELGTRIDKRDHVKLQDAVVTTLFSVSLGTLRSFLNPATRTFKAIFGKRDLQLVIWRKGIEVFIGTFENHSSLKVYGFQYVAGILIGLDGSWHLKVTAENAYANPKWNEIWAGKFDSYGGIAKMSVEVEGDGMAKQASGLADSILGNKFWELKTDVKAT